MHSLVVTSLTFCEFRNISYVTFGSLLNWQRRSNYACSNYCIHISCFCKFSYFLCFSFTITKHCVYKKNFKCWESAWSLKTYVCRLICIACDLRWNIQIKFLHKSYQTNILRLMVSYQNELRLFINKWFLYDICIIRYFVTKIFHF